MSIVGVLIGLVAAVIVFLVITSFITIAHIQLIAALIALVVFFLIAMNGARLRF